MMSDVFRIDFSEMLEEGKPLYEFKRIVEQALGHHRVILLERNSGQSDGHGDICYTVECPETSMYRVAITSFSSFRESEEETYTDIKDVIAWMLKENSTDKWQNVIASSYDPHHLTPSEREIIKMLGDAWNLFLKLPVQHPQHQQEMNSKIHDAQRIVMARVVERQEGL